MRLYYTSGGLYIYYCTYTYMYTCIQYIYIYRFVKWNHCIIIIYAFMFISQYFPGQCETVQRLSGWFSKPPRSLGAYNLKHHKILSLAPFASFLFAHVNFACATCHACMSKADRVDSQPLCYHQDTMHISSTLILIEQNPLDHCQHIQNKCD